MSRGVRVDYEALREREARAQEPAIPARQAYVVECEFQEPGERVWFPSLFEAEQTIVPNTCCTLKPVGPDYDGPKWVPE